MFSNAYFIIFRNFLLSIVILFPLTSLLNRDLSMTFLFLLGFVFNEMIHVENSLFSIKGRFCY